MSSNTRRTPRFDSKHPVVMMHHGPTGEKLVALALICREELGINPEDLADLERLYLVYEDTHASMIGQVPDIDVTDRYHNQAGSATEMVLNRLGLTDRPGMAEVIRDLGTNNNGDESAKLRGGWLKRLPLSFFWVVREAYGFPHDEKESIWRGFIIRRFLTVFAAYLRYVADPLDLNNEEFLAKRNEFLDAFPEFPHGSSHLLTLTGQAWYRFAKGEAVESIRDFVEEWLTWFETAGEIKGEILEALNNGDFGAENLPLGDFSAVIVKADDPRVTRAIFRSWEPDLVVVRNSSGNIAILPSLARRMRNQMVRLHEALNKLEPGLWHREDRVESGDNPRILNGSAAVGMPATQLTKAVVVRELRRAFNVR